MTSIWILTHGRTGDLKQMRTIAEALPAARIELKPLQFSLAKLAVLPWLAPWLLDRKSRESLAPPFPPIVMCAEAVTAGVALWIKQLSKNATKAVCIGRPSGAVDGFDLVVTTPQYRLADNPNILSLPLPVGTEQREVPSSHLDALRGELAVHPRPWVALLLGGPSAPDILDTSAMADLISSAAARVAEKGASLIAVTSPRTPPALLPMLHESRSIARVFEWGGSESYPAILRLADAFIVTSDSISLLTDALDTGKPVAVHRLPQRLGFFQQAIEVLDRSRSANWLFDSGFLEIRADRMRLIEGLSPLLTPIGNLVDKANLQLRSPISPDRNALVIARMQRIICSS